MPVTRYVWDVVNDCVLEEADELGAIQVTYTHEPALYGPVVSEYRGGSGFSHLYDALGSTTFLTNNAGTVTDTFRYDAWGNQVARTGTTQTPYTWIGRWGYQDDTATTGGYYIRKRTYKPTVARWASKDPLFSTASANTYAYAKNSPFRMIDPTGLIEWDFDSKSCTVKMIFRIKLEFVDPTQAQLIQESITNPTIILPPADPMQYTWTDARAAAFRNAFPGAIEECWNNGPFWIIPENPCCECKNGWHPKLKILLSGGPDNVAKIRANAPVDAKGDPYLQSMAGTESSTLDEADLGLWPSEQGERQITACHEFGHMIDLGHPGPNGGYSGDVSGLMGLGMLLRLQYFEKWRKALDVEFPECSTFKLQGSND